MSGSGLPGWRTLALVVAVTLGVLLAGAGFVIWSGVYSVAASKGHFAVMRWLLETAMEQSVETHSREGAVPDLNDPDLVRLGAGHFHSGCAPCHGAPGEPRGEVFAHMLPSPPSLSEAAKHWSPSELHWIVHNGVKYTGMPGWAARARGHEVWAVVAFLQRLPGMGEREYRELASGNADPELLERSWRNSGSDAADIAADCSRCHDASGKAPVSRLVPSLAGQSRAYLARAIEEYAEGARQSGIMQPVAAGLDSDQVRALAAHFSAMPRAPAGKTPPDPDAFARGREIASKGLRDQGIPPCLACHSGRASETFPLLFGQSAEYLAGQLRLWRQGQRSGTGHGAIMSVIARRLSDADIRDAAVYFEGASADSIGSVAGGAR